MRPRSNTARSPPSARGRTRVVGNPSAPPAPPTPRYVDRTGPHSACAPSPRFQYTRPFAKSTRLHTQSREPTLRVEVVVDPSPSTRIDEVGTPSVPAPEPTARYSSSRAPRNHTVRSSPLLRYRPPVAKNCWLPPGTVV